jgi:hypothetical protein
MHVDEIEEMLKKVTVFGKERFSRHRYCKT